MLTTRLFTIRSLFEGDREQHPLTAVAIAIGRWCYDPVLARPSACEDPRRNLPQMPEFRPGEAAQLLGVSVDTVRRWADSGRLATRRSAGGQRVIDGADLARLLAEAPPAAEPEAFSAQSARNRFTDIVTRVEKDGVTAVVEIQAGPHRIVSLLTAEAVDDLGLEPGRLAMALVKATNVIVEVPTEPAR